MLPSVSASVISEMPKKNSRRMGLSRPSGRPSDEAPAFEVTSDPPLTDDDRPVLHIPDGNAEVFR